jgi:hypothetical protein
MMPPCTGRLYYQSDHEQDHHRLLIALPCHVGSVIRPIFALLDTASEWCVLPHDLVVELGADLELLPVPSSLHTRFGLLSGALGRVSVRFDAVDGEPLEVEATCFASEEWLGPMVVGWKGCLERMIFGLDTRDQAFHFGAG